MQIKTIEQLAELPGKELRAYLLALTPEERTEINNAALLKARNAAVFRTMVDNLNNNTTDNKEA